MIKKDLLTVNSPQQEQVETMPTRKRKHFDPIEELPVSLPEEYNQPPLKKQKSDISSSLIGSLSSQEPSYFIFTTNSIVQEYSGTDIWTCTNKDCNIKKGDFVVIWKLDKTNPNTGGIFGLGKVISSNAKNEENEEGTCLVRYEQIAQPVLFKDDDEISSRCLEESTGMFSISSSEYFDLTRDCSVVDSIPNEESTSISISAGDTVAASGSDKELEDLFFSGDSNFGDDFPQGDSGGETNESSGGVLTNNNGDDDESSAVNDFVNQSLLSNVDNEGIFDLTAVDDNNFEEDFGIVD